jgi:hypothetical protein
MRIPLAKVVEAHENNAVHAVRFVMYWKLISAVDMKSKASDNRKQPSVAKNDREVDTCGVHNLHDMLGGLIAAGLVVAPLWQLRG